MIQNLPNFLSKQIVNKKMQYTYLEPEWPLFWLGKALF